MERNIGTPLTRLLRLALLAALVALVVAVTAAAEPPLECTHGASSVGPAVLIGDRLVRQRSDLTPHTDPCLAGHMLRPPPVQRK